MKNSKLVQKMSLQIFIFFGIALFIFYNKTNEEASKTKENHLKTVKNEENIELYNKNDDYYNSEVNQQTVNYNNMMLIDSVITTIQTYYVDEDRVSNKKLFDLLISSLEMLLDLETTRFSDSILVKIKGKQIRFKTPEVLKSELLLSHVLKLEKLISLVVKKTNKDSEMQAEIFYSKELDIILSSLLNSLDAHSNFLSKEDYTELQQGTNGKFGGLGVLVGMRDEILTVIRPLPRSPAERLGIRSKDKILSIDGKDTYGFTLNELVDYMRGEPGTSVHLNLLREGALSDEEVELVREVITVDSVEREILTRPYGKILKLKINSFTSRTVNEVNESIEYFNEIYDEKELKGIILDLRSNPGGLLDQAVKLSDLFLKNGTIVSTKGRHTEIELAYNQGKSEIFNPTIVLMNEESASASEIVAGALQDHNRAIIIGQPSFGKGSVQTIFELPEERAIKLTIARYYTPSGKSIQNIGIYPDIWLQPVYKNSKNNNLLGDYRYKNEKFLNYHLSNTENSSSKFSKNLGFYKGYYLKDKQTGFDEESEHDFELEMANLVFDHINKIYSENNVKKQRSHHLLALARKNINNKLKKWNQEVILYLKNNFSLVWEENTSKIKDELTIHVGDHTQKKILAGEVFPLEVSIKNNSNSKVNRISLYVRNEKNFIDTYEKVVGVINPNSIRKEIIEINIPTYLKNERIPYEVGLAVDGLAVPVKEFVQLKVDNRLKANLEIQTSLEQEKGGVVLGELEAYEHAKIAVRIKNTSEISAKGLELKIFNLSGLQVNLSNKKIDLDALLPQQEKIVYFDILGSDVVLSKKVNFGLLVKSKDLEYPFRRKFTISAYPSTDESVINNR